MRIIYFLIALCFIAACSKDAKDYKISELEHDQNANERVNKELSADDKLYIEAAKQRFVAEGMEAKLSDMTIAEVIEDEKQNGQPGAIEKLRDTKRKDLEFELINYTTESKDDSGSIQWEISIKNNGTKAIAGITVTLIIKGSNGEKMRSDRIVCTDRIEPGESGGCTSRKFDFDPAAGSKDQVVSKTSLDVLKSMAKFRVDAIAFSGK